jgi:hypothetical protein
LQTSGRGHAATGPRRVDPTQGRSVGMSETQQKVTSELTLDDRLREHFASVFADKRRVLELSQHYRREGYVKIPELAPPDVKDLVTDEVHRLLALHARRIDIRLKATSDTPRRMSTVGRRGIVADGRVIPEIYQSQAMMDFLSRLARERVILCPFEDEQFVLTKQERTGDTHGWHWGDFSFTLIWIIQAPPIEKGGMLQCVPHTDWDKADPRVHQYLIDHPIRSYHHETGDIYFLRSDTTLHRTVPLEEDCTRIILNTCWASEADAERAATHETMDAIFA